MSRDDPAAPFDDKFVATAHVCLILKVMQFVMTFWRLL